MRIMYVEDNQVNLGLVERIAKMGDHEVINSPNGTEALQKLATEPVDLILMDIELEGELDGIEVVKRLRARGDSRPIVAITAYAMVGDKERILQAGCDDYLPKPLPVAQFLNILSKYDPANDTVKTIRSVAGTKRLSEAKAKEAKQVTQTKQSTAPLSNKNGSEDVKSSHEPSKSVDPAPVPPGPSETKSTAQPLKLEAEVKVTREEKPGSNKEIPEQKTVETSETGHEASQSSTFNKPEEVIAEPTRDAEATIPFDPQQLEADIRAEHEAAMSKEETVRDQSVELQAERESHDKSDKV
jgi:two-component system cell cycle response regulator DivK